MNNIRIGLLSAPDMPMLGQQIQAILDAGLRIDALIMDSLPVKGRDLALHEERTEGQLPPIPLHAFMSHRIPCYNVENHNWQGMRELLKYLDIDVLVNAGTPRILKASTISAAPLGVINCHPGLLPLFRGCTCVEWAIYLDEPVGNTVHVMTEGIDEGPILLTEPLAFTPIDSYLDVRVNVYKAGHRLMAKALKMISEGCLDPVGRPQCEGRYFKPIEQNKLDEVKRRLAAGKYRFQNELPPGHNDAAA
jgi:methionyl-tRNA formyltransferase